MILISHPTGNPNVRQAALSFAENGVLEAFWTCVSWPQRTALDRLIPDGIVNELRRRSLPPSVLARTRFVPAREIGRLVAAKVGWRYPIRHEVGCLSVDAVYRALDRKVARAVGNGSAIRAVYAYEDGAAATFKAARLRGARRIYELPIGYWRVGKKTWDEEKELEPEWALTLPGINDSSEKLERKDEELSDADIVVVASSFTRETLGMARCAPKPVAVIPYGAPYTNEEPPFVRSGKRLRVLFVGALGQRKGMSYLLNALKILGDGVELTLIGRKTTDNCRPLNEALKKYCWIPSLPHAQILEEMGRHDVLVFPSLFEGFGLVILEAMSQGIPVITTTNTGGPDVIRHGVDGIIVPIRSADAIAVELDKLATDGPRLVEMKRAAFQSAKLQTWNIYRSRLADAVVDAISKPNGQSVVDAR